MKLIASACLLASFFASALASSTTTTTTNNSNNADGAAKVRHVVKRRGGLYESGGGRKLSDADLLFKRTYLCITSSGDFVFVEPEFTGVAVNSALGASIVQSGGCYDPGSVVIEDRPNGVRPKENFPSGRKFAGNKQPEFFPDPDPGYFLDGECVTTASNFAEITAHSCLLNLCLGGGGYDCFGLYGGTSFKFQPNRSTSQQVAPDLPPSYPTVIFGGTGAFAGATGTVDITTIAGRVSPDSSKEQIGFIIQQVNVVASVPLPPAP